MAVNIYDFEEEIGISTKEYWADDALKSYQQMLQGNQITGIAPLRNQQDYTAAYGNSGWAYACGSLIAISLAANGYGIYKNGKQIPQHPMLDLLKKPNPLMTGVEFAELTSLYIELAGECFWVLERSPLRVPVEMYLVQPWMVTINTDPKTGLIANYEVQTQVGQSIKIPPEDVLHQKAGNPLSLYRGMSTIQAMAAAIDLEHYAEKYNLKFFENAAIPFGVLESDSFVDDETAKYLEKKFGKQHKGVEKSQRVALLQGNIHYKPLGISQRDAEFLELRKFNRDQILAGFGIPKSCVGMVEDVNRANAETGEYVLARWVLRGRLTRMQARINQFLMPQYDERLEFVYDEPVPEDEDRRIKKFDSGASKGIITMDEYREHVLNLDPLPNGQGNVLLIPAQVLPTDPTDIVPEAPPAQPPPTPPVAPPVEPPPAAAVGHVEEKRTVPGAAGALRYTQSHYRVLVPKFRKRMKGLYKAQAAKVLAAFDTQKSVTKIKADPLIEIVQEDREFIERSIAPYYPSAYDAGIQLAPQVFGIDIDFTLNHPEAIRALWNMPYKFSKELTDTTTGQIRTQIAEGMQAGEGIPEMRKRLEGIYGDAQSRRAETAARTETCSAFSQGSLDSWNNSEVCTGKEWLWGGDNCPDGSCPDCEADGVIGLDETFSSGEDAPPNHANCTCCLLPSTEPL